MVVNRYKTNHLGIKQEIVVCIAHKWFHFGIMLTSCFLNVSMSIQHQGHGCEWKWKSLVMSSCLRPYGLYRLAGILQARIWWVAVPFSMGSSQQGSNPGPTCIGNWDYLYQLTYQKLKGYGHTTMLDKWANRWVYRLIRLCVIGNHFYLWSMMMEWARVIPGLKEEA